MILILGGPGAVVIGNVLGLQVGVLGVALAFGLSLLCAAYMGGAPGPKLFASIAEYCDGWLPFGGAGVREALPALRDACERVDRDPSELRIIPFGTLYDASKVDYYASLGIEEIVLRIPAGTRDVVLAELDRLAAVIHAGR